MSEHLGVCSGSVLLSPSTVLIKASGGRQRGRMDGAEEEEEEEEETHV